MRQNCQSYRRNNYLITSIYLKCYGTPFSEPAFGASIVIPARPGQDEPTVIRLWGAAEDCGGRMRSHITGALVALSAAKKLFPGISGVRFVSDEQSFTGNGQSPASRRKELDLWADLDAALKGLAVTWDCRKADYEPHLRIAGAFGMGAKGGPFLSREKAVSVDGIYQPYRPTFEGNAA